MQPKQTQQVSQKNGGYEGNGVKWTILSKLGFTYLSPASNVQKVKKLVSADNPRTLSIHGGRHWVLTTSHTGQGFTINDSTGNSKTSIPNSEMATSRCFKPPKKLLLIKLLNLY